MFADMSESDGDRSLQMVDGMMASEATMSSLNKVEFIGWEQYCQNCHVHRNAPIRTLKDCLDGTRGRLDLGVSS